MEPFHTDATKPDDILIDYLSWADAPHEVWEALRKLTLRLKQAEAVARQLRREDDADDNMGTMYGVDDR